MRQGDPVSDTRLTRVVRLPTATNGPLHRMLAAATSARGIEEGRRVVIKSSSCRWLHGSPGYRPGSQSAGRYVYASLPSG